MRTNPPQTSQLIPPTRYKPDEQHERKDEVPLLEPEVNRVFAKVGTPLLVILERVLGVVVNLHPPAHVCPQEAPKRRVRVVFFVGVGMMLAMIGDPADRAPFGGTAPDDRQNILEPARPKCKTAVSQQAVIGQANPDSAGQPVQENANGNARPGKIGRHKGKKGERCKDPIQINGTHASRAGAGCAVVVVVIINLCSYTSLRMDSWWWEG